MVDRRVRHADPSSALLRLTRERVRLPSDELHRPPGLRRANQAAPQHADGPEVTVGAEAYGGTCSEAGSQWAIVST